MIGIHRVTLQRWIKRFRINPEQAIPMGNLREQKLYRWSQRDVQKLRRFKYRQYRKGRGRKPAAKRKLRLTFWRARKRWESQVAVVQGIIACLEDLMAELGITPKRHFRESTGGNHLENAWRAFSSAKDELRKALWQLPQFYR